MFAIVVESSSCDEGVKVLAQALITKELPATAAYISSFCIVRSHLIMAESATDLRAVKPSSDHLRHESEGGSDQAESARIRARFRGRRHLFTDHALTAGGGPWLSTTIH